MSNFLIFRYLLLFEFLAKTCFFLVMLIFSYVYINLVYSLVCGGRNQNGRCLPQLVSPFFLTELELMDLATCLSEPHPPQCWGYNCLPVNSDLQCLQSKNFTNCGLIPVHWFCSLTLIC